MNTDNYITTDTMLVAALLSCGIKHSSTKQYNPGKVEFVFANTPDLQNVVTGHYMGALTVPSLTMGNNYKRLLSIIAEIKYGNSTTSTDSPAKA